MVLELNRKYEDVSRAHEQERRVSGVTKVSAHPIAWGGGGGSAVWKEDTI